MDFEYTAVIIIDDDDLEIMCNRIENGESFDEAFDNVMASYDDCDYYNCGYIEKDVKKEVKRRLTERRKENAFYRWKYKSSIHW